MQTGDAAASEERVATGNGSGGGIGRSGSGAGAVSSMERVRSIHLFVPPSSNSAHCADRVDEWTTAGRNDWLAAVFVSIRCAAMRFDHSDSNNNSS